MTSKATSRSLLTVLDAEHPEWRPLLVVIKEALREAERPQWARLVPALEHPGRGGRPLLDGAVITVGPRLVGRWVRRILGIAAAAGTEVKPLARAVAAGWVDPLALFPGAGAPKRHRFPQLAHPRTGQPGPPSGTGASIAQPRLPYYRAARRPPRPTGP